MGHFLVAIMKQSSLVGGRRSNTTPATSTTDATNLVGVSGEALLVSDMAAVPVALTHEIAHSVFRSVTTATSTIVDSSSSSIGSSSSISSSSSQQAGERVPKFV